jgi:hypothetical protein
MQGPTPKKMKLGRAGNPRVPLEEGAVPAPTYLAHRRAAPLGTPAAPHALLDREPALTRRARDRSRTRSRLVQQAYSDSNF